MNKKKSSPKQPFLYRTSFTNNGFGRMKNDTVNITEKSVKQQVNSATLYTS